MNTFQSSSKWGDSLNFLNYEERTVSGHKTPLLRKNDFMLSKMASGKVGVFKFVKVKPCGDPPDMFFGTVKDVGYLSDHPEVPPVIHGYAAEYTKNDSVIKFGCASISIQLLRHAYGLSPPYIGNAGNRTVSSITLTVVRP